MDTKKNLPKLFVLAFVLAGVGLVVAKNFSGGSGGNDYAEIKVPALSPMAKKGEVAFNENCAACHGENAGGTESGPPLIHNVYNPGHHGDQAFYLAAKNGVRRHHWNFGDMPPQRQVKPAEVRNIVKYIREVQQANGIFYQQHTM